MCRLILLTNYNDILPLLDVILVDWNAALVEVLSVTILEEVDRNTAVDVTTAIVVESIIDVDVATAVDDVPIGGRGRTSKYIYYTIYIWWLTDVIATILCRTSRASRFGWYVKFYQKWLNLS